MAEIRFTTERMKEVYNRMGEIKQQLQEGITNTSQALSDVSKNVDSERMKQMILSYITKSQDINTKLVKDMTALEEYLQMKIANYSKIDEEGAESLSDVSSLLSQLEG